MYNVKETQEKMDQIRDVATQALEREKAWIAYARIKKFIRDVDPQHIKDNMLWMLLEYLPETEETTDDKRRHVTYYHMISELMDDFTNLKLNNTAEMRAYAEAWGDFPL
jgi:hypothetical protein